MRPKHRKDQKHTPGGFITGNRRYQRHRRRSNRGDVSMGRVKQSKT